MTKHKIKEDICYRQDSTSEISTEESIYPPLFHINTWTKSVPICVNILLLITIFILYLMVLNMMTFK